MFGRDIFTKGEKVFINYNKWFSDISYRQEISDKLGLDFSDDGINDVSISGRGSSFDGTKHAGDAHKMDVLNRWKVFVDNPAYLELLNTRDLLDYSTKIFGHIPGTEIFFN